MLSQHALQVVSQHALQQVSKGRSAPGGCLVLGGLLLGGHLVQGGFSSWGMPSGDPPPGRLLLWAVRILLECILIYTNMRHRELLTSLVSLM